MPQKEPILNKKQDGIENDCFIVNYDIVMTISEHVPRFGEIKQSLMFGYVCFYC